PGQAEWTTSSSALHSGPFGRAWELMRLLGLVIPGDLACFVESLKVGFDGSKRPDDALSPN
ncbi:hypothetical protein ACLOJK_026838, partial [Asimina triloba]